MHTRSSLGASKRGNGKSSWPSSVHQIYTLQLGVLSSISNLTKHFWVLCFELILAIWYQRFYNPKVSSSLNWYPTTPWPNQRYVSLFVLFWMVSIPFRSMTSIKENAFQIWRANLHYFRATLIIVVNKVLCCARRGTLGSKKNWQIPKHRVKNRRNADTAFKIGHVYLML